MSLGSVRDAKVFVETLSCPPLRLFDVKCIAAFTGIFKNDIKLQLGRHEPQPKAFDCVAVQVADWRNG